MHLSTWCSVKPFNPEPTARGLEGDASTGDMGT